MARGNDLPFPRGSTYFEGDSTLATSTEGVNLEGKVYEYDDHTASQGVGHGTGHRLRLRVIRNASGGNLTAGRGVFLRTASTAVFGSRALGHTFPAGGYGICVDDAYSTGYNIISNDLFYGVIAGPVRMRKSLRTATLTVREAVAFDTGGRLINCTSNYFQLGVASETKTSQTTGSYTLVYVGSDYVRED